jgi:hypothetical protein
MINNNLTDQKSNNFASSIWTVPKNTDVFYLESAFKKLLV